MSPNQVLTGQLAAVMQGSEPLCKFVESSETGASMTFVDSSDLSSWNHTSYESEQANVIRLQKFDLAAELHIRSEPRKLKVAQAYAKSSRIAISSSRSKARAQPKRAANIPISPERNS
jgi:hypothetical protein